MKEYDVVYRGWHYDVCHVKLRKGYKPGEDEVDPKGPYTYAEACRRAKALREDSGRTARWGFKGGR